MAYKIVDHCGDDQYRNSLLAKTDAANEKILLVIQCNPSVASDTRSDPTVGKVCFWAEENGFKNVIFLNLFGKRSPRVCDIEGIEYTALVGAENDEMIRKHLNPMTTLVLAWGGSLPVTREQYKKRLNELSELLCGQKIHVVGSLSYGIYPRHGRMWNKGNRDLKEINWEALAIDS